jgi:hypothetical protein
MSKVIPMTSFLALLQIIIAAWSLYGLPVPDTEDDESSVSPLRKKKGKVSSNL